ncbi:hypothetical protein [Nocardioides coralli]|uniref:hypothetical protein n=1 Tax=Nocardioides coralli TaxID=2872154 RepID=UPI001CA3B2F5|nr:hypothetical protein [Nocardioides coralli]QZY28321.1 hypothetical protein K6T13_12665 [Nocardioides coralli]
MPELPRIVRRWRAAFARWRVSWDRRVPVVTLLVALVVGLELGFLLGRWGFPGGPDEPPATDSARLSGAPRDEADARRSPGVRLRTCKAAYATQGQALEALGAALMQWEVHAGAMNKLALGVITPDTAQAFWDRVREDTIGDLEALAEAQDALGEPTAGCPAPATRMPARLETCASAVEARHAELARAAAALERWRSQVRQMEDLRRGATTVEQVVRTWQRSWQGSGRQVRDIRRGMRAVDGDADCGG